MTRMLATQAYWVAAPGHGELRTEHVPAEPRPGHALVRARCSGISAGTERLVGLGLVPAEAAAAMACPGMAGSFALPVKYGYCLVGTVVAGTGVDGRVFTMHPHQALAEVPESGLLPLPDAIDDACATLLPNLETALNAVWDAELQPGERTVVLGGGQIGALVAYWLAREHRCEATLVEMRPQRREWLRRLAWIGEVLAPEDVVPGACAVAFHASGTAPGLQLAIDAVGFEGRVVELSWYGTRAVPLRLGGAFHWQRKRILASQVGSVARSRRRDLDRPGRLRLVRDRMAEDAATLAPLVGSPLPFDDMPTLMQGLYHGEAPDPIPFVRYAEAT